VWERTRDWCVRPPGCPVHINIDYTDQELPAGCIAGPGNVSATGETGHLSNIPLARFDGMYTPEVAVVRPAH
jgi:hypothetical protein